MIEAGTPNFCPDSVPLVEKAPLFVLGIFGIPEPKNK